LVCWLWIRLNTRKRGFPSVTPTNLGDHGLNNLESTLYVLKLLRKPEVFLASVLEKISCLSIFAIIFHLRRKLSMIIWRIWNSLYLRIICIKFDWNWFLRSRKCKSLTDGQRAIKKKSFLLRWAKMLGKGIPFLFSYLFIIRHDM
jgi:hypothetical protein